MNKIFVVIPAYNESKTIGQLLDNIKQLGFEAIVIDDGSSDGTAEVARRAGVFVISHQKNLGKGCSLREGFLNAVRLGCCGVITMDGDGQHNPRDITKFLEEHKKSNADLIIGNRMHNPEGMPFVRKITNLFMSFILSSFVTKKIEDTQCGFRFISRKALEEMELKSKKYDIESEMLIAARKKKLKIASCKIESIYKGERSFINPVTDTIRFIKLLLRNG